MRIITALITTLLVAAPLAAAAATPHSGGEAIPLLPIPARTPAVVQEELTPGISGSRDDLFQALAEPASVQYKVLVVPGPGAEDRTAYLDRVLDAWGWPGQETLLLVVYPQAHHDIRFAMGAGFWQSRVSVQEMVDYLYIHYYSGVRKGDAAGALANLIRAVNQRMDSHRKPLAWLEVKSGGGVGGHISYDREPYVPTLRMEQRETNSLKEAREYLGRGVALPPELEGGALRLHRVFDEFGRLVSTGVAETEMGFWARYRPAGDHRVVATYDGEAKTEMRTFTGRPALMVTLIYAGGSKGMVEIWMEDGNWVYEIKGYSRDLSRVVRMAESLE